ncbi:MAG: hypothetical protein MJ152_03450 [Clostridia bacterium]|nr:hypothetical protein [Clostridia bacterium]
MGGIIAVKQFEKPSKQLYFVEIQTFTNYSAANTLANQIKKENGAGFVYFDGTYHVLVSYYPNSDTAEKVTQNLASTYANAKTFAIDINTSAYNKNLTKQQNNLTANLCTTTENLISGLYKNSISFDKQEINFNQLKTTLTDYSSTYNSVYNDFIDEYKNNKEYQKIKENFENIKKSMQNLMFCDVNDMNFLIKYETINISIHLKNALDLF